MDRRDVRRYWNTRPIATESVPYAAGTPESFAALYRAWLEDMERQRRVANLLHLALGRKTLEVGCGTAREGRFLAHHGVDYTGVDQSRTTIGLARDHFRMAGLQAQFVNADGIALPFPDESFDYVFSIGALHHVPETEEACRELVRVARPGAVVRVMLYNRESYHYALVRWIVIPLIRILLALPGGYALSQRGPRKLREMAGVARERGAERETLLSASTDTSSGGEGQTNPLSRFFTEQELRAIFGDLEDHRIWRSRLNYFPVPGPLRRWVERRWGFFLQMEARKPDRVG